MATLWAIPRGPDGGGDIDGVRSLPLPLGVAGFGGVSSSRVRRAARSDTSWLSQVVPRCLVAEIVRAYTDPSSGRAPTQGCRLELAEHEETTMSIEGGDDPVGDSTRRGTRLRAGEAS